MAGQADAPNNPQKSGQTKKDPGQIPGKTQERMIKMNAFMTDIVKNPYFQSLPTWMQEHVIQSGVEFRSEDELRNFALDFLDQN